MWAIHRPQRAIPPTDSGFKCPSTQETVFAWRSYTERGIFYLDFKFEKPKRAGWKNKLYTDAVYPVNWYNWFSHPICQANMLIAKPFDKIIFFSRCSVLRTRWIPAHSYQIMIPSYQIIPITYPDTQCMLYLHIFTIIYLHLPQKQPNASRYTIHWVSGISTEVPSIFSG